MREGEDNVVVLPVTTTQTHTPDSFLRCLDLHIAQNENVEDLVTIIRHRRAPMSFHASTADVERVISMLTAGLAFMTQRYLELQSEGKTDGRNPETDPGAA